MENTIDCLFVGHNEMQFEEYEKKVEIMGKDSGAYRDLNLSFIKYKNRLYTAQDVYNKFYAKVNPNDRVSKPLAIGNTFSLTIAYLGSYLHRRGFSIAYVNSFQSDKQKLAELLKNNNIMSIAIPTTLYTSMFPILEIINFVKEFNNTAKIIIGGPFIATQMKTQDKTIVQDLFKTIGADYYVNNSEGERALSELLHAIKSEKSVSNISSLSYKAGNNFITNESMSENNSLDENFVNWKLFSNDIGKFVAVRTSISCPFSCSFCGFPQHAGKYRTCSIESIENELNRISELEQVKSVYFIDDTFNVPKERFKDILRMIIKNKYKFKWNSHYRCQFADRETIELMKESGCEGVFLGIESGNQKILQNMNKHATLDDYKKGIELLNEYNIITHASFIIGFPGEDSETVKDTINFIEETKPTFYRTQLWYCDPFTPIWQDRDKYGIIGSQFEWKHKTMDSHSACDIIDNIFMSVKNSVWLPQNNFEFEGVFQLLHRDMKLEQIKEFVNAFNKGVKNKLVKEHNNEIDEEAIKSLKQSLYKQNNNFNDNKLQISNDEDVFMMDAGFDLE